MIYNPEARDDVIEICVNSREKNDAKKFCKLLGIGVSTWYRNLGNAEIQRHCGWQRDCRIAVYLCLREAALGDIRG